MTNQEFGSVVALTNPYDGIYCTGTLIAPHIVLTAAHCVDRETPDKVNIYVGDGFEQSAERKLQGQYEVKSIHMHPSLPSERRGPLTEYILDEFNTVDMAILTLKREVKEVQPASLLVAPKEIWSQLGAQNQFKAVGFGHTIDEFLSQNSPRGEKRKVDLPFVSLDFQFIDARAKDKDTCTADSGGPLFVKHEGQWKMLSVLSRSRGFAYCGQNKVPILYGLTAHSLCWLAQYTDVAPQLRKEACERQSEIVKQCRDIPCKQDLEQCHSDQFVQECAAFCKGNAICVSSCLKQKPILCRRQYCISQKNTCAEKVLQNFLSK